MYATFGSEPANSVMSLVFKGFLSPVFVLLIVSYRSHVEHVSDLEEPKPKLNLVTKTSALYHTIHSTKCTSLQRQCTTQI